jgi:D-3-phosphoglycerate dehydrogenase
MSQPVHIVVADTSEGAGRDLSIEQKNFPQPHHLERFTYEGDPETLTAACRDADAVLTDFVPFSRAVLEQMKSCRVISIAATGWDNVDIDAAADLGISVCCVGEYCTNEVADHAMALVLALNRKLFSYHHQVQVQKSWAWDEVTGIRRLAGQKIGIIGLGRIGRAVAERARAFGLEVLAFDPWMSPEDAPHGVRTVNFNELLAHSDIISLHCNLGPENAGLLNTDAFAQMRRKPLLINVSRGVLVDESAMVQALDSGQLSGAALDVLTEEPPHLEDHPLAGRDNVILTPHVAFYSDQSLHENREISSSNIRHFFAGNFDKVNCFVHQAE